MPTAPLEATAAIPQAARETLRRRAPSERAAEQPKTARSTPWSIFRSQLRPIATGLGTCLIVCVAIELAIFRSGFFLDHLSVSEPVSPAAKLALAERSRDARVLYVGDSAVMTDVAPAEVSAACACGLGFNGGFPAADPSLTSAMTRRLLEYEHPSLVVIGMSPWSVDAATRFVDGGGARDVFAPSELYALAPPTDLLGRVDDAVGQVWSAYGQRNLAKEWIGALVPGHRYDESLRGLYVPPGSATSDAELAASAAHYFSDAEGEPSVSAPGAVVTSELVDELRARGIGVAFLVPPLHPAAEAYAGAYIARTDAIIRELAAQKGVPLIDCRPSVSSGDFRDLTHLDQAGAMKYSACVGESLTAVTRV